MEFDSKQPLYISIEDLELIRALVDKADKNEIGGMGIVVFDEEYNKFLVKNLYTPSQIISPGEVDWDNVGLSEFLLECFTPANNGGLPYDIKENENFGIFSWHSHGNGSTFWSTTDEDFISKVRKESKFIVSLVTNTKKEDTLRTDIFVNPASIGICGLSDSFHFTDKSIELKILYSQEEEALLNNLSEAEEIEKELKEELINKIEEEIKELKTSYEPEFKKIAEDAKEAKNEIKNSLLALSKDYIDNNNVENFIEEKVEKIFKEKIRKAADKQSHWWQSIGVDDEDDYYYSNYYKQNVLESGSVVNDDEELWIYDKSAKNVSLVTRKEFRSNMSYELLPSKGDYDDDFYSSLTLDAKVYFIHRTKIDRKHNPGIQNMDADDFAEHLTKHYVKMDPPEILFVMTRCGQMEMLVWDVWNMTINNGFCDIESKEMIDLFKKAGYC